MDDILENDDVNVYWECLSMEWEEEIPYARKFPRYVNFADLAVTY